MQQASPEQAAAAGGDPLQQAMLELVESSNRALGQSSEKLAALELELADLRRQLQGIEHRLSSERDQRLMAEVLVAITELLRRQEALVARGNGLGRTVAAACCGSLLAGLLVLASLAWWDQHRQPQASSAQPRESSRTGTAPPATPRQPPPPPQTQPQTLQLRCAQPCWLEARDVKTGRRVYYNTLKGSTTLPIGSGLEVFSGRADVLKIRINDGPEQRFSTIMVGKRTFMPTTSMPATFMPAPR